MLFPLTAAAIEQLLNQVNKLDPDLAEMLTPVQHQQLSVRINDLDLLITLMFDGKKFHVYSQGEPSEHCFIKADLNTLLALKQPETVTHLIRAGKLELEGDLHLAQQYSKAFNSLNIDWADNLSRYLGDGPAYQLVNSIKTMQKQFEQHTSSAEQGFTSLLQDELKVTIHPLESQQFKSQCRALQQDLAKLEQRVDALLKNH